MKIAVTYENGNIYPHFGKSKELKFYEIEGNKVVSTTVTPNEGGGHTAMAKMLAVKGITTVICGGLGGGAKQALSDNNIEFYPGADGNTDELVEAFLKGELVYNMETECGCHTVVDER